MSRKDSVFIDLSDTGDLVDGVSDHPTQFRTPLVSRKKRRRGRFRVAIKGVSAVVRKSDYGKSPWCRTGRTASSDGVVPGQRFSSSPDSVSDRTKRKDNPQLPY